MSAPLSLSPTIDSISTMINVLSAVFNCLFKLSLTIIVRDYVELHAVFSYTFLFHVLSLIHSYCNR